MGNFCQKSPEVISLQKPLLDNKKNNDSCQNTNNENDEKIVFSGDKRNNKFFESKDDKKIKNNYFLNKIQPENFVNKNQNQMSTKLVSANEALKSFNSPNKKLKKVNNEFLKGQCIGEGFFSSVYFGLSCNTGEIVAIQKIFFSNFKTKNKAPFEEIVNVINKAVYEFSLINHNNIIKYFHTQPSDSENDEIEILLEFCNGGSIKQLLNKFDSFDEKLIRLYIKQVLEGLVYLHDKNIIHRNLKNTNILVDGNGTVKISDLIISNVLIGDDQENLYDYITKNGKESPYWIAPEILNKEYKISTSLDIWNLGCMVIEMATNTAPWANLAKSDEEIIKLISESSIPPKFPSHLSKECKSFLSCCLQKDPQKRLTAKRLLKHPFFDVKSQKTETPHKNNERKSSNNEDAKNLDLLKQKSFSSEEVLYENTQGEIQKSGKTSDEKNLGFLLLSNKTNKMGVKNVIIKEKEEEKDESNKVASKNLVNILANNSRVKNDANFSITMTVSDHSEIPYTMEFINKTHLILDRIEGKFEEGNDDNNNIIKGNKVKVKNVIKEDQIDEKNKDLEDSDLDSSVRNMLEQYKLSLLDINNKENFEKLGTFHLNEEELKKLEIFFKNKCSIIV